MQEVADAVLSVIGAENVRVFDANVPTDQAGDIYEPGSVDEPVVVTVDLPYVVIYMNFGDDNQPRLAGRTAQRSVFWQITSVGLTPEQTRWAHKRARRALKDRRLVVHVVDDATGQPTGETYQSGRISIGESQRMRRDDTTTDPDGNPVFYLVDTCSVKLQNKR